MPLFKSAKTASVGDIFTQDIVIAIMGPTGSGKSNLIDVVTKQPTNKKRAGDGLESYTQKVQAIRLRGHSVYQDRLVFVDTPGFNDTHRSDMEILELISDWLRKTYEKKVTLSGILYIHRITDNRLAGTPHRNLRMFAELCGDKAVDKVILVTTMWDKVDQHTGEGREKELVNRYWAEMLSRGATSWRFENTESSAWQIINTLLKKQTLKEAVLLQEELVDLKKHLNETKAGMTLFDNLHALLEKQRQIVEQLEKDARVQNQPEIAEQMKAEQARIQAELQQTFTQIKSMKISVGRKLILLFKKKPRANSLNVPDV